MSAPSTAYETSMMLSSANWTSTSAPLGTAENISRTALWEYAARPEPSMIRASARGSSMATSPNGWPSSEVVTVRTSPASANTISLYLASFSLTAPMTSPKASAGAETSAVRF